jgi:hypothetical protein
MKYLNKFLSHAAAYATVFTTGVFLFAKIAGVPELTMTFGRYLLILLFSALASSMENIFTAEKLPLWSKYAIHYTTLAAAFYFIFLNVRNSAGSAKFNFASVMASLVIFSICYGVFFAVKKCNSIPKSKEKSINKKAESESYKPRFK